AFKRTWCGSAGALRGTPSGGGTDGYEWGLVCLGAPTPGGWILRTEEVITPRSGTTLGMGDCKVYTISGGVLTLRDEIVEAYNSQKSEIASGLPVQANNCGGVPVIDVVDCDEEEE